MKPSKKLLIRNYGKAEGFGAFTVSKIPLKFQLITELKYDYLSNSKMVERIARCCLEFIKGRFKRKII